MFKPKHFAPTLDSFARQTLPPAIYNKRGVAGLELMDERILVTLDDLRGHIDVPLLVNGGGDKRDVYTQSGLRDIGHYKTYEVMEGSFSQHKYGRGIDCRSSKMSAHDIRKHIIENKHLYPHISFMEVSPIGGNNMGWVHFDCRTRITEEDIRYWSNDLGYVSEERVLEEKL